VLEQYGMENGKLVEETEFLQAKVAGLSRLGKILVDVLGLLLLFMGLFRVHPLFGERSASIRGVTLENWKKFSNGTALDTRTGLTWMTQDFRSTEGRAPDNWGEAMAWAEKLNLQKYGGHDDWRVPGIVEYQEIFDERNSRLAFDLDRGRPVGYPPAFEDGGGYGFWSRDAVGEKAAKYFFFIGGYSKTEQRDYRHPSISIRLVRGKSV